MKEMITFSSSLIILLLQLSLFFCKEIDYKTINNEEYMVLNYKDKKDFNLTADNEQFIYIKMDADKILSDKYAYFYVYIEDPTKFEFYYKFEKEGETKEFIYLKSNMVTNHGSAHTIYQKMEKPKESGNTLYIKMRVYNYHKGQKISVESSETQTDLFLMLSILIYSSSFLTFAIVAISLYCLYKKAKEFNPYNSGEDIIFAKVRPEDYQ
jgi:hypothetical protein